MALIKCRKCGKEISDKSRVCVSCGTRIEVDGSGPLKKMITWSKHHIIISLIVFILVVVGLPTLIYFRNAKMVIIQGNSMSPTLKDGERKLYKTTDKIDRFNVVIIEYGQYGVLIKRVYGMPGETIEIKNENIYIDGKKIEDDYSYGNTGDYETITLKNDEYFVLGDNRNNSRDSRDIGPIKKENIKGVLINVK